MSGGYAIAQGLTPPAKGTPDKYLLCPKCQGILVFQSEEEALDYAEGSLLSGRVEGASDCRIVWLDPLECQN